MLGYIDNTKIYIYNFHQELLPTTTLAFWYFIICLLNMVNLEVIADIKCSILLRKT